MRLRSLVGVLALAALAGTLLVIPGPARAAPANYFVKLERIEVEPSFGPFSKVRVYTNPMTIEGGVLTGLAASDFILAIGSARRKELPGLIPFEYTDAPVDLAIVLQTSLRFTPALEDLQEPLTKFLGHLNKATTRVTIVTYSGDDPHASSLGDPGRAARAVSNIIPEDIPDKPRLLSGVDRAIKVLKNAPPPASGLAPRRLMLVIGDGLNEDDESGAERPEFNRRAKVATAEGIVIHTLAFSMNDKRTPYYNLAQLSKRTSGTFRMATERAAFAPMLDNFETEIKRQLVLSYLLPTAVILGEKVKVLCRSASCGVDPDKPLESNEHLAPATPLCAGAACGVSEACVAGTCRMANIERAGSSLPQTLAFSALALVGIGTGTVLLRRRKKKRRLEEEAKAPPPQQVAPQLVMPDFSNIPYLQNSPQLQQMQQMYAKMNQANQGVAPAAAAAPVLPPGKAGTLYVLSGPRQGQRLPLRHGFTIGKTAGCDLLVDDGLAAGYHAQFHLDAAGGCTVVDMNTPNGTFVNGVRSARQRLTHGTTVRVGGTEVRYLQG